MKPFTTLLGAIVVFILANALPAGATVTVLRDYRLGEADPGVTVGLPSTVSVDSANSNNLTMTAAPVYSADTVTSSISLISLQFNGTNYGIANTVSNLTDNFGIETWVKTAAASGTHYIAYNGNTGANGWGIFQNGSNYEAQLGGSTVFGSAPAATNKWTHLALVRNSGTTSLYVDGLPGGSSLWPCYAPDTAFAIATAPDNPGGNTWNGSIDEVRVFTFAPGAFQRSDLLLERPVLNISHQGDQMLVTWPTNRAVQFGLETGTNLFDWTPLSAFLVDDLFANSNSISDGSHFFRLNDAQRCFNTNVPIQLELITWQDDGYPPDLVTNIYTSYYDCCGNDSFYTNDTTPLPVDNASSTTYMSASVIGDATNCFSDYTYSWTIYNGVSTDYTAQGITGYLTPQLTILPNTLPGDPNIEVDFYLTVTRLADGRQDVFYFRTAPTGSLWTVAYLESCQGQGNCSDPTDEPASEPHR